MLHSKRHYSTPTTYKSPLKIINTPYGNISEDKIPIIEKEEPYLIYGRMVLFGFVLICIIAIISNLMYKSANKEDFGYNQYKEYKFLDKCDNSSAWGEGINAANISVNAATIYISNIEVDLPLYQVALITRNGEIYNIDIKRDLFVNKMNVNNGGSKFEINLPQQLNIIEIILKFDTNLLFLNNTYLKNKSELKNKKMHKTVKVEFYDLEKNKVWEAYEFIGDVDEKNIKIFKEKEISKEYYNRITDYKDEEEFLYNYISNLNQE